MKRHKLFSLTMIFMIFFLLQIGCTVSNPATTSPGEGSSAANTVPVSRISSTLTPLPVTPTPQKTPDLAPTVGLSPTVDILPTTTESPKGIPTPPNDEVTQQVLWLFETNNGCQLPCWWGVTPGQTEWSVAEEFFTNFAQGIYRTSSTPELEFFEPVIPLPPEVFAEAQLNLGVLVRNGIVEFINTRVSLGNTPPGYLTPYTLSPFLSTYGQPSEVWISTYSSTFEHNELPFDVVLFYPNKGIAALYFDNGVRQGDVVQGCPQVGPAKFLSLWYAPLNLTFEDVQSGAGVYSEDYLALEESTEMSIVTFYETFKEPENTTCLETPAELWR